MIHFLLDIDGTIAERNTPIFLALCNSKLKLGIDETTLQTLRYHEFLRLPEVMSYRQSLGERNFERALNWIELDPYHQMHMLPLKHAVAGVRRLAYTGSLTYCTTRKAAYTDQIHVQMAQATHTWLSIHHFPSPDRVLFYDSPLDKLCGITELAMRDANYLVVIDVQYEPLLADLLSLSQTLLHKIQYSLTLYAFGLVDIARSDTIEVVAFPGWGQTDECVQAWMKALEDRFAHVSLRLKSWR